MSELRAVAAPELTARFDPRTGGTGNWLGADAATSLPLGDGRTLWIFNDTFWRTSGTGTPTSRIGSEFLNDSLAIQTGADLATADLKFIRNPLGGNWFPVSTTHYAWPEGAIVIDGDLFMFSKRVAMANWIRDDGWCVHRIPDALTVSPVNWKPVLVYQSAATSCRPLLSLREGGVDTLPGTGYVYAHAIWLGDGWRFARWTRADFMANNFGAVTWAQGDLSWGGPDSYTTGTEQSDAFLAADGSIHRRDDGRYVLIAAGAFDTLAPPGTTNGFQIRSKMTAHVSEKSGNGIYYPGSSYFPIDPILQVGDRCADTLDNGYSGTVLAVPTRTTRTVQHDSVWGGKTITASVDRFQRMTGSERGFYTPPENQNTTFSTYAGKAHPQLPGGGLVCSYVDNGPNDDENGQPLPNGLRYDLSAYWPKFVRVLPPTIDRLHVRDSSLEWTTSGGPDRLEVRVGTEPWAELTDLSLTSFPVTLPRRGLAEIQLRATGIGGTVVGTTTVLKVGKFGRVSGQVVRLAPA